MKKILSIGLILALTFTLNVLVQAEEPDNPFELSQYEQEIDGLVTKEEVTELKEEATKLFEKEKYEDAEEALDKWAKSANKLANIISSGLDPFYSASRSERSDFSYSKTTEISSYERLSNSLKKERNLAMVKQAESLVELERNEEAIEVYRQALQVISIDNWDLWIRASNGIYEIIGIEKIEE